MLYPLSYGAGGAKDTLPVAASPVGRLDDACHGVGTRFGADAPLLPVLRDGALVGLLYRESVVGYVRMREMLGFEPRR